MFGTLLASGAARQPIGRPAIAAGILHLIILMGAVRLTATASPASPVVVRDTIPFQLALPRNPIPSSRAHPAPVPFAPAPLPQMRSTVLPRIELALPYQAADWAGLVGNAAGRPAAPEVPADSVGFRFSTGEVDELPELRSPLNPPYPEHLRRAGINGSVHLEYVILASGRVDSASVRVIASTEPAFTIAVIGVVLSASFKPARRRGLPVAVLVQQTIRFQNR
jgi:protein TonB